MKTEVTREHLDAILKDLPAGSQGHKLATAYIARMQTAANHDNAIWGAYCAQFGFTAADHGRKFWFKGSEYQIVTLNPGAWKFPVNAKRLRDGKTYRFPAEVVKRYLPALTKVA